jgi:DNA-directed RNA polymerase specialized sigma24 family protein
VAFVSRHDGEDRDAGLADLAMTPDDMLGNAERDAMVRAIVRGLPEPDRHVVEANYFGGQSLEQASAAAGRSKWWAIRVLAEAMQKMEIELRRRHLDASVL